MTTIINSGPAIKQALPMVHFTEYLSGNEPLFPLVMEFWLNHGVARDQKIPEIKSERNAA